MASWLQRFGTGAPDPAAIGRDRLGGKGAGLAAMALLRLPVPPGFTLTTDVCRHYLATGELPPDLFPAIEDALATLGAETGRSFGGDQRPLLLSVRAGTRVPMPGMMDTVLNVGMNDAVAAALAGVLGEDFAYDSYCRFIQMYGDVVFGIDAGVIEERLDGRSDGTAKPRHMAETLKAIVAEESGEALPQAPAEQLRGVIAATYRAWSGGRARAFRALHNIADGDGVAITVQAMVFGNLGARSGTGLANTRHPASGEHALSGSFLVDAQGDDVVAGLREPGCLTARDRRATGSQQVSFEEGFPAAFAELQRVAGILEAHFRDMQNIEFTVEDGRLWLLQTRTGRRSAGAAVRIAVDLAEEGIMARDEALMAVAPATLDQLLHPTIDPGVKREVLATGFPASPGAASGAIVFSAAEAETARLAGRRVVLVRAETSPDDVHGMKAAEAVLTSRGGMTSHAAVVARGIGKPCICGAASLRIDAAAGILVAGARTLARGDFITVDGSTGEILNGAVPTRQPDLSPEFAELMNWADRRRRLGVRANAETPSDAEAARRFGAEGIGLCRTEHMFFDDDRIRAMREMILAEDGGKRREALGRLLPMHRADLARIFVIMRGLPVTVRLIDPPLHEFLPQSEEEIFRWAATLAMDPVDLRQRTDRLAEFNPMLGHRGVRLLISYPEIIEMQARATLEAALDAEAAMGVEVAPEIMIPLVASRAELDIARDGIAKAAEAVRRERKRVPAYFVGTMVELPRAALQAGKIAPGADFFSFGTNDLTQTTFGISRDDSGSFLRTYERKGILDRDPFASIDREGVGELIKIAVERGRAAKPGLRIGVCGEHGGDPDSVEFFNEIGLDYVSCSPFRVPIARLAAAQAAIRAERADRALTRPQG